jgi:hypothetical protein
MTVREMENRLSSQELAEWMAYWSIEPFGAARDDYRAGLLAATVANCAGSKKALQPTDFIHIYSQPKQMSYIDRRQQQASQMAMFKNLSEQTNGKT